MPLISIVVPTLNEEKYIPNLLKSLEKQTIKDFELIAVDSNSEDKTVEILEKWGAKILYSERGNIGKARNKGLKNAKAKIVVHTSADVIAPPNWLENLTKPLIKGEAEASFGSIYLQNPTALEKLGEIVLNNIIIPIINITPFVYCSGDNIAVKKEEAIKVGGINENLHTGEDVEFIKRMKENGNKVVFVKNAKIYTSPRRIRKWNPIKYTLFHMKNFIKINTKKEGEKTYEPIR